MPGFNEKSPISRFGLAQFRILRPCFAPLFSSIRCRGRTNRGARRVRVQKRRKIKEAEEEEGLGGGWRTRQKREGRRGRVARRRERENGRAARKRKGVCQQHRRKPRKHAGRVAPSRLLFFLPPSPPLAAHTPRACSSCFCYFAHTNSSRAARRARSAWGEIGRRGGTGPERDGRGPVHRPVSD